MRKSRLQQTQIIVMFWNGACRRQAEELGSGKHPLIKRDDGEDPAAMQVDARLCPTSPTITRAKNIAAISTRHY